MRMIHFRVSLHSFASLCSINKTFSLMNHNNIVNLFLTSNYRKFAIILSLTEVSRNQPVRNQVNQRLTGTVKNEIKKHVRKLVQFMAIHVTVS